MRYVALAMLVCSGCSGVDDPEFNSVLESNTASYVASDDPDPRYDYALTITLTYRNTSLLIVRVPRCTATIAEANYSVVKVGSGVAAWNPNLTCATFGTPYTDLRPGESHTDTLVLHAPWQRLFNGQPVGDFEGRFYIIYETQICALVSTTGACTPVNRIETVRSNEFTITTP